MREVIAADGAASVSINLRQLAAPPSFKTAFGNAFRTRLSFGRAQRCEVGQIGRKGEQIAKYILCLLRVAAEKRFNQSQQAAAEINERRPDETGRSIPAPTMRYPAYARRFEM